MAEEGSLVVMVGSQPDQEVDNQPDLGDRILAD